MVHMEDSDAGSSQSDTAEQTSHIPNERLIKGVLASIIAASSFTKQIFLPALPSVQSAFDVSAAQVQLTVSLPLVVTAVATLLYGPVIDCQNSVTKNFSSDVHSFDAQGISLIAMCTR